MNEHLAGSQAAHDDPISAHKATDDPDPSGIDGACIDAIRFLRIDGVERAGSGHPGTPMESAPLAYRLSAGHLRHDRAQPDWPNRDRFVLSGGHASMLRYASLHLSGYDPAIEDLRQLRQCGSRTPGHAERGRTPGDDEALVASGKE